MDFAANAVLDAIAPPPRAAGAKAAPAPERDGPSFEDHVEAAVRAETPEPDAAPVESTQPVESAEAETPADVEVESAAAAPAPANDAAASQAVAVQMIASAPAPAAPKTDAAKAPVEAADAVAPAAAAPDEAAETAAPIQPNAAPRAKDASGEAKADGAAQAEAPQAKAAVPAPVTQNVNTPAAQQTAQTQAQTAPTGAEQAVQAASAPAPTTIAPALTREAATRTEKAASARSDAKAEAPEFKAEAQAQTAETPRNAGKNTAAPVVAKEAGPANAAPVTINAGDALPQAPSASATSAASAAHAAQTQTAVADNAARAAPAAAQVAREIVRRFDGENTKFELRLDPPELGRVEVRLEVSRDHKVTAVVSADSPQALTELARQARELTQQLQSAGLELSDNGLTFDLRQGQQGSEHAEADEASGNGEAAADETQTVQTSTARPLGLERWRGVRVDMMI